MPFSRNADLDSERREAGFDLDFDFPAREGLRLDCLAIAKGVLPSWCGKQMTLLESLTEMVCIRETNIGQNNEYYPDMPVVYTMHLP